LLTRDEAINLLKANVKNRKILLHMFAVEAIMRRLAQHLNENEEVWGLAGLLHDIDYERTEGTPERHGVAAQQILKGRVPEEVLRAILSHNFEHTGVQPETSMEKALIASDAISGLLIACALVMPSKKLSEVSLRTVKRKFKAKDFARGVSRERILFCEQIGIPKEKFFEISLEALKGIAPKLGL